MSHESLSFRLDTGTPNPRHLLSLGRRILTLNRVYSTHDYLVEVIVSGFGRYLDLKGTLEIGPGSIIQRFPNRDHQFECDGEDGLVSHYLRFPESILTLMRNDLDYPLNRPVLNGLTARAAGSIFADCLTDWRRSKAYTARLSASLACLNRLFELQGSLSRISPVMVEAHARLKLLENYHVPLRDIAAQLGMNYVSFRKAFKQAFGESPGAFQIRQRVEHAKKLLINSEMSIGEIAEALGYQDPYVFSRQFKTQTGYSPSGWLRS